MKTAVLQRFYTLRRLAALVRVPTVERRYYIATAAALPVVVLGPYVVPFMLALVFFAATMMGYVHMAVRAGARFWQAALIPLAMLPFAGLFGSVETLPNWMQIMAHLFPVTYIISGIRTLITYGAFDAAAFVASVMLTGVYLFFIYLWASARTA